MSHMRVADVSNIELRIQLRVGSAVRPYVGDAARGLGTSGKVQPFPCMNVNRCARPSGRHSHGVWIAR
jgi:hypothetical protein